MNAEAKRLVTDAEAAHWRIWRDVKDTGHVLVTEENLMALLDTIAALRDRLSEWIAVSEYPPLDDMCAVAREQAVALLRQLRGEDA